MINSLQQLRLGQTNERWVDILNNNFAYMDLMKTTEGEVLATINTAVNTHNTSALAHTDLFNSKVDKVEGKQLSAEDFTTALRNKLNNIEATAEVNIIEFVKQNGQVLSINPDDRSVNIITPQLTDSINDETAVVGERKYVTPYAVKEYVAAKVSSTFNYKGVRLFENLPSSGQSYGDVYSVSNAFTLHGTPYPGGTSVVWAPANAEIAVSHWDALSGAVDLSHLQPKTDNGLDTDEKTVVGAINEIWTIVHDLDVATPSYKGLLSAADKTKLDTLFYDEDLSVSGMGLVRNSVLTTALNSKVDVAAVGEANGIPSLDGVGRIPEIQMPLSVINNVATAYPITTVDAEWGNQTTDNITWLKTGVPGKRPVATYRTIYRYNYLGTVAEYSDLAELSAAAEVRDTWLVTSTGEYYRWSGLTWENAGTELPTGSEAIDGYESIVAQYTFTGTTISVTTDNRFDGLVVTV